MPFAFNSYGDDTLMFSTPVPFAAMFATKEKLIGFYIAGKFFTRRSNRATAKLLKPFPSGKVMSVLTCIDTQFSLMPHFAHPITVDFGNILASNFF